MDTFEHKSPPGYKSGLKAGNNFVWERADWEKCPCGLIHSNRVIPDSYWDKWKNLKKDTSLKTTNGIILVRGEKEVWVTQSYWNFFGFPKGSEESKLENSVTGAIRELKEETGYDLESGIFQTDLTSCDQIRWYDVTKRRQYNFFIVYVPSWFHITTTPLDDIEITSCGWVSIDKLFTIKFSKAMNEICKQFIDFQKSHSYNDFVENRTRRLNDTWERHFDKTL